MAASFGRFPIQRGIRFLRVILPQSRHLTLGREYVLSAVQTKIQLPFKTCLRIRKCMYSAAKTSTAVDGQSTFDSMLAERKSQARKSILVQVKSRRTATDFFNFCKQHAEVKLMYHYVLAADKEFLLVEFETKDDLRNILRETKFCDGEALPVHSQFMSFNGEEEEQSASVIDYRPPDNKDIHKKLLVSSDISEQMQHLYDTTKLHDLEIRLRFLVCAQLEAAASGIFPEGLVYPFGSSVNGCGQTCCDLDMVLDLKPKSYRLSKKAKNRSLVYQAKLVNYNSRMQSQRSLEVVGDIVSVMLPGCVGVQRILQARVPIIKFGHSFTGLECDLTTLNMTGVYMSELIYLFGMYDSRLQPLLFTVRKWARDHGITQSVPGLWITNFQLLLMVIFFLQMRPQPILPPLQSLIQTAEQNDERITEGVNCTFLRDVTKFPKTTNEETLGELLMEFFAFYEAFDYKDRGLSIVQGTDVMKSNHSALYIENPLELSLNVSKNVGVNNISKLKSSFHDALWHLESELTPNQTDAWGIVSLFKPASEVHHRGFQVANLFEGLELRGTSKQTKKADKKSKVEVQVESSKPVSAYEYIVKEIVNNSLRSIVQSKGRTSKVTAKTPVAAAVLPVAVTANPRKSSPQQKRVTRLMNQSTNVKPKRNKVKNEIWKANW